MRAVSEAILTGRPQGCAPTMPRSGLPGSSIVGAHPCGRPAGVPLRLSSLDQPMEQLVGINAAALGSVATRQPSP